VITVPPYGLGAIATPSDPQFSNVVILMHFNGTNGSTAPFTNSATGKPNSDVLGTSALNTTTKYFGTASLNVASASGAACCYWAGATIGANGNMSSGDFTIEGWLRPTTVNSLQVVYDNRLAPTTVSWSPEIYLDTTGRIKYFANGVDRITSANSVMTAATWHHIAYCKNGSNGRLFVNGTQVGSTYTDSNTYVAGDVRIGCAVNNASGCIGFYDDWRVTKGYARYTANFSVPTAPFPNH
jgi:hypothetical protein